MGVLWNGGSRNDPGVNLKIITLAVVQLVYNNIHYILILFQLEVSDLCDTFDILCVIGKLCRISPVPISKPSNP